MKGNQVKEQKEIETGKSMWNSKLQEPEKVKGAQFTVWESVKVRGSSAIIHR